MTANLYDTTDFTTVLGDSQLVGNGNTYSFPGLITTPEYTLKFVSDNAGDCEGLASEWHGDIPVSITNPDAFSERVLDIHHPIEPRLVTPLLWTLRSVRTPARRWRSPSGSDRHGSQMSPTV